MNGIERLKNKQKYHLTLSKLLFPDFPPEENPKIEDKPKPKIEEDYIIINVNEFNDIKK